MPFRPPAQRNDLTPGQWTSYKNDLILLETVSGTYRYRVIDTAIVGPSNIEVLRPRQNPSLALVTCYPFGFVGPAPLRYVVRAYSIESERVAGIGRRVEWTNHAGPNDLS